MTNKATKNLIICQITDTHIVPEGKDWLNNKLTQTEIRLEKIINHINKRIPKPDLVIHTGDVVDDGSKKSYIHSKQLLDKLDTQYFLTCGNHDNFVNLKYVFYNHNYFSDPKFSHYIIDFSAIRIIVLDTQVRGQEYGEMCRYRVRWLQETLKNSNKKSIVFMHHFPITVNNSLFDGINLLNSDGFAELIKNNNKILGLYSGHYHYAATGEFANKLCWVSPSTAPSHILLKNNVVGLNYSSPSYSVHYVNQNGVVSSDVVTLPFTK